MTHSKQPTVFFTLFGVTFFADVVFHMLWGLL